MPSNAPYAECVICEQPIEPPADAASAGERPPDPYDPDDHGEYKARHVGCEME
jgi:hypothetical protein